MKFIVVFFAIAIYSANAKIYSSLEFGNIMRAHGIPEAQLPKWHCIAHFASKYNSGMKNPGSYGIFQINEEHWCSSPGVNNPRNLCKMSCSSFTDDDIADDIICAQKMYERHIGIEGNGFGPWKGYPC